MLFFIFTFLLIIFFMMLIIPLVDHVDSVDEETTITTTTTTTHTEDVMEFEGNLKRSWHGKQPFVVDPVDKDRVYLNTSDDIYEDGAGKWWRIV
jgi:hypothetical protein